MYELSIDSAFSAAHAIVIEGEREPRHDHDCGDTVVVAGDELDEEGLLCDFHVIERHVRRILEPFENADLNRTPPFDLINPTAEHVARHIAEQLAPALPAGITVQRVSVTEAPGCRATFRVSRS